MLANPTKKLRVDNADGSRRKNGCRVPLTRREDLVAWLERKAAAGGFAVDPATLRIIPRGREYFYKSGVHGLHNAVEFQGTLTVSAASLFRATIAAGIGSAKAFGFGLLAIVPVSARHNSVS